MRIISILCYIGCLISVLGFHTRVNVGKRLRRLPMEQDRTSNEETYLRVPGTDQQRLQENTVSVASFTGAALSALMPLQAAQAYGDADSLAAKKKGKKEKLKVKETDSGVKYVELKQGNGPYPNDGDFVTIVYTAYLNNGTVFDDINVKGRKPLSFRIGQKQIIKGVEDVLFLMQPGAERTCTIPAALAYGSKGVKLPSGDILVPPDETLRYYIKLKSVGAGYN